MLDIYTFTHYLYYHQNRLSAFSAPFSLFYLDLPYYYVLWIFKYLFYNVQGKTTITVGNTNSDTIKYLIVQPYHPLKLFLFHYISCFPNLLIRDILRLHIYICAHTNISFPYFPFIYIYIAFCCNRHLRYTYVWLIDQMVDCCSVLINKTHTLINWNNTFGTFILMFDRNIFCRRTSASQITNKQNGQYISNFP